MAMSDPDPWRAMLRHAIATLAYRGGAVLREAPGAFGDLRIGAGTRTPREILSHIGDLLEWIVSLARGPGSWPDTVVGEWEQELARFHGGLRRLDDFLASPEPLAAPPERLFQGPLADALTHVGQLGLLRRLAQAPVRGENYFVADIQVGRVGPDQATPRRTFN